MASITKSFPIEGSATLIEDIAKGGRKEAKAMMSKTAPLSTALSNW